MKERQDQRLMSGQNILLYIKKQQQSWHFVENKNSEI